MNQNASSSTPHTPYPSIYQSLNALSLSFPFILFPLLLIHDTLIAVLDCIYLSISNRILFVISWQLERRCLEMMPANDGDDNDDGADAKKTRQTNRHKHILTSTDTGLNDNYYEKKRENEDGLIHQQNIFTSKYAFQSTINNQRYVRVFHTVVISIPREYHGKKPLFSTRRLLTS